MGNFKRAVCSTCDATKQLTAVMMKPNKNLLNACNRL